MFESKCQIMWGVYTSRAKLWMVHKFNMFTRRGATDIYTKIQVG